MIAYSEVTPGLRSFNAGEISLPMKMRSDFTKYNNACKELENMLILTQGPTTRRPGTKYIEFVPPDLYIETIANYELTYISENGKIWGIPLDFSDYTTLNLDVGSARNVGGGIVGLPCTGHPFASGDVVSIVGTTHYNGNQTLTAGTTANELQFTDTYQVEAFDGSETVVELITTTAGAGRMAQDSSGNLYCGHNWDGTNSTYITKIETDGTKVYDFLNPDDWPTNDLINSTCLGVAISSDDAHLYIWIQSPTITPYGFMQKYELSTGDKVWSSHVSWPGFDMEIDSAGNAYALTLGNAVKFASSDGAQTEFTLMGERKIPLWMTGNCSSAIAIDNTMSYTSGKTGVLLVGGSQSALGAGGAALIYNLAIRDLDDTDGAQTALGGVYQNALYRTYSISTECIVTYNDYIYVLVSDGIFYKLDSSLNTIASATAPTYGVGLFVDLWGHIVIVSQDWIVGQSEVFWYYDADLNYLGKTDGFSTTILRAWDAAVGGAWSQGNACFYPGLFASDDAEFAAVDSNEPERLIPFEYSKNDAYVILLGDNFMSFFREQ